MSQTDRINRRIVLASRPHGAPTQDNFRLSSKMIPEIKEGRSCCARFFCRSTPICAGA